MFQCNGLFKLDWLLIRMFHQELVCSYFSVSFQLRTQTVLRCSQLELKTLCLKAILPVFSQLKAVFCLFSQLKGKRHRLFIVVCFFFPTIKQSSLITHKWRYVYTDRHPRWFKLLKQNRVQNWEIVSYLAIKWVH